MLRCEFGSVLVWGMRSVPGAVATGLALTSVDAATNDSFRTRLRHDPVATAPGTDSMTCVAKRAKEPGHFLTQPELCSHGWSCRLNPDRNA